MTLRTIAAACIAAASFGTVASASNTIVDIAAGDDRFSTLVAAVTAAGLVETLQGPGPFTVYAPVNDAFAALPEGTVETLLKPENKGQLTDSKNAATSNATADADCCSDFAASTLTAILHTGSNGAAPGPCAKYGAECAVSHRRQ